MKELALEAEREDLIPGELRHASLYARRASRFC